MSDLSQQTTVGVIGAGAMGAGIAQVAASAGHEVHLADAAAPSIERARAAHAKAFARDVVKGRKTQEQADAALARIHYVAGASASDLASFASCGFVIEAIVEDLSIKRAVLTTLEDIVPPDAVLASNTSSLSIAALAGACRHSDRVIGVHFFNPAPVMPLVEIVPGLTTSPALADAVQAMVDGWGKTTVRAADTPGFIVNRVARPFYGEALRLREEGVADCATIDWAMRELGGFRMGPFELMDFIGHDVNYAVTSSVFEAMFFDPRYKPALMQRRLVEAGWLGRKSGRGYYDYRDGAERPAPNTDPALGAQLLERIVCMLVNEAVDAVHLQIASPADIELAMTRGVNYPRGLLAWGDEMGAAHVLGVLDALHADYGEDRYRASVRLRRAVASGARLQS